MRRHVYENLLFHIIVLYIHDFTLSILQENLPNYPTHHLGYVDDGLVALRNVLVDSVGCFCIEP